MLGYAICDMAPKLLEFIGIVRETQCERAFNTNPAIGAVWVAREVWG